MTAGPSREISNRDEEESRFISTERRRTVERKLNGYYLEIRQRVDTRHVVDFSNTFEAEIEKYDNWERQLRMLMIIRMTF